MNTSKLFYKKIKENDTIVIFGHVNPDGDCYGSQIGLKEAIIATFPTKRVFAVGSGFAAGVDLFGAMDEVSDEVVKESLCIAVDFNAVNRSEDNRLTTGKDLIMLDHHMKGEVFGSVQIIETEKIAASEIIANFIIENKMKLTYKGASALYMGIVTDSGRFQYQPITAETFKICSYLTSFKIDMKRMYDRLYVVDETSLSFKGYVYSHYEKTKKGVIYCKLTKEVLSQFGYDGHRGAVMVNLLAGVKDCPIWVFFGEDADGKTFVEYRSNGLNVQQVAVAFGGGGHQCAAGCNVPSMDKVPEILKALDKVIEESGR